MISSCVLKKALVKELFAGSGFAMSALSWATDCKQFAEGYRPFIVCPGHMANDLSLEVNGGCDHSQSSHLKKKLIRHSSLNRI